jgi:hypothetical protein
MWLLLSSCQPQPTPVPEITPTRPVALTGERPVVQRFPSPAYGVQTFLWWGLDMENWQSGDLPDDLTLTAEMGFGWVKQEFSWRNIEEIEKGKYDWWRADQIVGAVELAGLKLIARLDRQPFWSQEPGSYPEENAPPANLTDFADFCHAIADRYRGRISAYQIWNEPNLGREWGDQAPDPAQYTELLKVCYLAIKSADPQAIVISAGLAPTGTRSPEVMPDVDFLHGMYDAGAAAYFDVLGLNAPGYKAAPEISPDEAAANPDYGGGRWFAFRHVEDMRAIMVARGDELKQIAILEMGWTLDQIDPAYSWFAVDEATQADYLVRAYQYARQYWRPWIGLMTTIYIANPNWTSENEQWWWSIVLPDGVPRPAYYALRDMEK